MTALYSPLSAAEFAAMKQRFIAAGNRLTDEQLLDLADAYHEMLRQRRAIRARHPRVALEPRSYVSDI
jgi:hypothetical protein